MAASGGSPGPLADDALGTEESGDQRSVPNKRMKRRTESRELVPNKRMKRRTESRELVGGDNTDTAEKKRQRKTAAPAVGEGPSSAAPTINTPPLPARYPPFPRPAHGKDVWELRISKLAKKDPRRNLPTVMRPKHPHTAASVTSSRDKAVVREVARSIVSITPVALDGMVMLERTGIVVGWNKTRKCARILTGSRTVSRCDPKPRLHVHLPNKTVLEGQLLFFSEHYDIALLEISSESDLPLQLPSFGSNPNYGQDVFVLARDEESYLMARHGKILWLEKTDYLGRNCHMFLSCKPPVGGTGGPVIDLDGNITGMVFEDFSSNPPILAISTILTCMEMWMKFSRIAHPIHGLRLRTVELMEVSLQEVLYLDHNISSGYIVDEVSVGSTAERLGIRCGDVIVSFDGLRDHTLPQLEDFLLSLGWKLLERSTDSSSSDLKLEVYDLLGRSARTITLPVGFHDASEVL